MTIRRQLLRAFVGSTLLMVIAGGASVLGLCIISGHLQQLSDRNLPTIASSNAIAREAGALCVKLNDFGNHLALGDHPTELNRAIASGFDRLDAATARTADLFAELKIQPKHLRALVTESKSLRHAWEQMVEAPATQANLATAELFDDRAQHVLELALSCQQEVSDQVAADLQSASRTATSAAWTTILLGGALLIVALFQGIIFPKRLAARLDRIRKKAQLIGAGDLSARLEVIGADEIDQVATSFNDMTASLRASRDQLEHDALHDSLTGLPNRALFLERIDRRLAEAHRRQDFAFAVFFLDLDRFKLVNDSLGHAVGDALLRQVASRIQVVLEQSGTTPASHTLARLGGDEFTILLEHLAKTEEVDGVALAIRDALAAPMILEGHELIISCSIGVAIGRSTYDEGKSLLRDADAALYRAKSTGRNGHVVFDATMHEDVIRRLRIEHGLRRAIEREEFVLHFQPIINLSTGELNGFEALIRWQRDGDLVRPDLFIPIAEETGQIVQIGEWVISRACRQFREWREKYNGQPRMLSVNVSKRQLADPNLLPHLRRVLAETGIPPSCLVIEITESMLGELNATGAMISQIRALGVRVYVDDFGTGYSTLSGLHRYPIDGLKIDRSFVTKGNVERDQLAVLNTLVELAHNLNIPVIAEGIETPEQVAMLQAIACDRGQGFHFSRPITAGDAAALLGQAGGQEARNAA